MSQTRRPAAKKTASENGQPAGKRFVLSEIISKIEEDRPSIEVEGADGKVFKIPPAELWPDDATKLAGEDNEACCRALLGDQYDDWAAQGGTFGVLNEIIFQAAGADVGKSSTS